MDSQIEKCEADQISVALVTEAESLQVKETELVPLTANEQESGEITPAGPVIEEIEMLNDHCEKFLRIDGKIYWQQETPKGIKNHFLCENLKVVAFARDKHSRNWGRLLELQDLDGNIHRHYIQIQQIGRDGDQIIGELRSMGLMTTMHAFLTKQIISFIFLSKPHDGTRVRCTDRTGWQTDDLYLMPDNTNIGNQAEAYVYQSATNIAVPCSRKGDLKSWRTNVTQLCVGNSRLVFAVCVAFAAVLIRLLKLEGGGFHYFGSSSGGKTTALFVSASVQSDPKVYIQRWRATGNGLEGMAKLHNDANLILDELGEIDPREAGNCSYLLANGGGKIRSKTSGDAKQPALWTLYFLSAGEITLAEHMAEGGKQAKAGQEIRCVDIPADAGEGLGLFETIHGFESPAKFADALKLNTQEHHGFALVPFIEAVINNKDELIPKVREYIDNFIEFCVPKGASGQISRVATRFALVAAAGEFASAMGITGWAELEAEKAAITCFNAWLGNRDHFGNQEELRTISQIRGYLQTYGDSRFVTARYTSVKLESLDTRTLSRRDGYKIVDGENNITAFYILPDAFTNDVCSGLNINTTIKYLAEKEYLKKDSEGKNQQAKRLPGLTGQARIYHVDASILNT